MEGGWPARGVLSLTGSLLSTGRGNTFTIDCSGFDLHGVDPPAFQAVFDRKPFRPIIKYSVPTHVNVSFTLSVILEADAQLQLLTSFLWMNLIWDNPFISWNPEKCVGLNKLTIVAEKLWLPDIFIVESMDVDEMPSGLIAYVSSEGRIKYDKPMRVTNICNLDIFYFPFDQQNCTFTFTSFLYTVDSMLLGMDKEVWEITDMSRDVIHTQGEWELLGINKTSPKMLVGDNLYDQIMFYVAIRRRPSLYIINLLVPSGFLVAINALSFYLPAESENRAPFKMTLLLGYNVFLGTPLISMFALPSGVYFALCLSLMMLSLLETVFIAYLLHLATNQPPPCRGGSTPCCCTAPAQGNAAPLLSPPHLLFPHPHFSEPVELVGKVPGPGEAEPARGSGWTRAQREQELWVQFSHMMDTLLFLLYLLFMASCILTVIGLWNT
uniref:Uncharacterized protein n=1 Tax=Propithecus coquereli TaxID=379532 RepID=A0A2K6GRR0_PROCO